MSASNAPDRAAFRPLAAVQPRIMALYGPCKQRRQRILNASRPPFSPRVAQRPNLGDIAIAAGSSNVTIHCHFDDKMHLFETVIIYAACNLSAGLVGPLPLDRRVELALERFARVFAERVMNSAETGYTFYQLARVRVGATVGQINVSQPCKMDLHGSDQNTFAVYFKGKIAAGEIAGDDPHFLVQHFVQILFAHQCCRHGSGDVAGSGRIH